MISHLFRPVRFLASSVALCMALTAGSVAQAQDAVTLKRAYKKGDVHRYKTTMNLEGESPMGAMQIENTIITTETVKDIKDDGTVVVTIKTDSSVMKLNGQERQAPGVPSEMTIQYDKNGRFVKREDVGPQRRGPGLLRLNPLSNFEYPDRPLKIGEEWKFTLPQIEGYREKVTGVFMLVGKEAKSEAIPIETLKAKVTVETTLPNPMGDAAPFKSKSDLWIAPDTGLLMKLEMTVDDLSFGPVQGLKMKMTRLWIKPEAKN